MKIRGNGTFQSFTPEDELAHPSGEDPNWNESVVIYVWDPTQDIYLFFRIGHESNRGPNGLRVLWNNLWVKNRYYRNYDYQDLRPEDKRKDGFGGGPNCTYTFDGQHHWQMADGDVSARLVMKDFHPGFGFWPVGAGTIVNDVARNHLEAAGTVSGVVKFEGAEYTLTNALAYRDRSWGVRKWDTMRSHTWIPVIFGQDLSLQVITWYAADRSLAKFGYVQKGDELIVPKNIDVVSFVEVDGISNRGGKIILTLDDGEKLECLYRAIGPGGTSEHHGYPVTDTLCEVELNGGERVGVGCYEAGFNAMGGTMLPNPKTLINGKMENGIYSFKKLPPVC